MGKDETPCRACAKPFLDTRNEWLWDVFQSVATQSRSGGMGGFLGFDYNTLPFILQAKEVPESMWWQVLDALEILAPIASRYWNEKEDK